MKLRVTRRAAVLALVLVALGSAATAGASGDDALVFSPNARPYGQSYGAWAAHWWHWALSQPTATNPVLDPTGAQCANEQSGRVWFLAGALVGPPVQRTCTVPPGKALLFPVLTNVYCAFAFDPTGTVPPDPPELRTEEFARFAASFPASGLAATIDGVSIPEIQQRYFEQSKLFSVVLPAGNVFGLPTGLVLDPCADEGYFLVVKPLKPGTHTIAFRGTFEGTPPATVDVTYTITVPRH